MRLFWTLACAFLISSASLIAQPYEDSMHLQSSAFLDRTAIPVLYTAQGKGIQPPLAWHEPPEGTLSLALVLKDPDAPSGTFIHWILYNIPPSTRELPTGKAFPSGTLVGANSTAKYDYYPPNPPSGTHRYIFTLYALDALLLLPRSATLDDLQSAMEGHILSESTLIGTYAKASGR